MKSKYIECEHCHRRFNLHRLNHSYFIDYSGKHIEVPIKAKRVWCTDCNQFTIAQIGLSVSIAEDYIEYLKLDNSKYRVKRFISKQYRSRKRKNDDDIIKTKALIKYLENNGGRSFTSCLRCGSTKVAFIDVKNEIWTCPICENGILSIHETDDDGIRYRMSNPVEVKMKFKTSENKSGIPWIIECALALMDNEMLYYKHLKGVYPNNFKKSRHIIEAFIDERIWFICAILIHNYPLLTEASKKQFVANFEYTDDIRQLVCWQLAYRYKYAEEIPYNQHKINGVDFISFGVQRIHYYLDELTYFHQAKYPLPTEILYPLYNPYSTCNHRQRFDNLDLFKTIELWKIIITTINAFYCRRLEVEAHYFDYHKLALHVSMMSAEEIDKIIEENYNQYNLFAKYLQAQ